MTFTIASKLNDPVFGEYDLPIRMFIEQKAESYAQNSQLSSMFLMMDSKKHAESVGEMAGMEGPQPVGENGTYPETEWGMGRMKDFRHMTWKNRLSFSREAVDDSQILDLKTRPEAFVAAHYRTREEFGAALYGAACEGATSFTYKGKSFDASANDGLALFASHVNKVNKATQVNGFTDAFSATALAAAETAMQNLTGEVGETLALCPNTIMIPNDYVLKMEVFAALGADKQPGSANNDYNFVFGRYNVIINPYLNKFITGGKKPWILLDTVYRDSYAGALWFDRVDMEITPMIDPGNDALVYKEYSRWSAGFSDWRFALAGGMASGGTLVTG